MHELAGCGDVTLVQPGAIYEITFAGEAGGTLCTAFADCEVTTGSGGTILLAELPDQAALYRLVERVRDLGLELIELRRVASPASLTPGRSGQTLSPSIHMGVVSRSPRRPSGWLFPRQRNPGGHPGKPPPVRRGLPYGEPPIPPGLWEAPP